MPCFCNLIFFCFFTFQYIENLKIEMSEVVRSLASKSELLFFVFTTIYQNATYILHTSSNHLSTKQSLFFLAGNSFSPL